jgi:CIC family chloride channel protein
MSNQTFILILSGLIGIFSGIAAVLLKTAVHSIQDFLTEDFYTEYANFMYIIYPLIGISAAFLIGKFIFRDVGGAWNSRCAIHYIQKLQLDPKGKNV